jgi:hypothetical protein
MLPLLTAVFCIRSCSSHAPCITDQPADVSSNTVQSLQTSLLRCTEFRYENLLQSANLDDSRGNGSVIWKLFFGNWFSGCGSVCVSRGPLMVGQWKSQVRSTSLSISQSFSRSVIQLVNRLIRQTGNREVSRSVNQSVDWPVTQYVSQAVS